MKILRAIIRFIKGLFSTTKKFPTDQELAERRAEATYDSRMEKQSWFRSFGYKHNGQHYARLNKPVR